MSDHEDYGDVDEGLAERIRESATLPRPVPRCDAGSAQVSAEQTWALILASLADAARQQDLATQAELERRLGVRL